MHKFNPENSHLLDDQRRGELLPAYQILEKALVKEGESIADVGCGTGYFSFPAADLVGPKGKVYALDISYEILETLEKKMEVRDERNVVPLVSGENDFKLPEESVDLVFLSLIFHEAENKEAFLAEIRRVLKPEGRVFILEWSESAEIGPDSEEKLTTEEAKALLLKAGFKLHSEPEVNENFYALLAYQA